MTIVHVRHFQILGQFWSVLWSLRDTNLEKSTMYCSHIIGKTWVVSSTLIQFLQTYWDKHPKDWDEQLQHMQCIKSPFEACFCYLLRSHVDFYFSTKYVRVGHHDAKKAVQQIVQELQETSQAIFTARHENHHPFEAEKQVWL